MFLPLPAAVFIPVKPCFVIGLSATLICAFKAISKTDVKNVIVFTHNIIRSSSELIQMCPYVLDRIESAVKGKIRVPGEKPVRARK